MGTLLGASYAAMILAAVLTQPLIFAGLLIVATVLDYVVERRFGWLVGLLRRIQLAISHRAFVQIFLYLLLVAGTNHVRGTSRRELIVVTAFALAVPLVRAGYNGLLTLVRRRRVDAVEVRNLPVASIRDLVPIPNILHRDAGSRLVLIGVVPVLVGAVGIWAEAIWPFVVAVACYVVLLVVAGVFVVRVLFRLVEGRDREAQLEEASRALQAYEPEVLLYFSGSSKSTYQVNVWLETLAATGRRCAILVRERHTVGRLQRTELPIVCIPSSVDLMNFPLPEVRVGLYVANVGKNIHFLREPRVKHVFIGHGDSDKVASFNPFSKVYDEVWVAGQAGRDRYARAQVGVRDDAIVEVGRPQLDVLERRTGPAGTPVTVFYAPTWEGWTDDDFQTSLTEMGPPMVERLLASPLPIRIIYKPHPLTGTRSRTAVEADRRIQELIRAAPPVEPRPGAVNAEGPGEGGAEQAAARLAGIVRDLADSEVTVEQAKQWEAEWSRVFWAAHAGRHVVFTGSRPELFDCFNRVDVLISDLSSLVSDFVATGKPYVVANPKDEPEEEFRDTYPSTRAAYLLGPDVTAIDAIMASVVGEDPMAPAREELRAYLLGPDEPPAIERWNGALERLIRVAEDEWSGEHGAGPPPGPSTAPPADATVLADDPVDEPADRQAGGPADGTASPAGGPAGWAVADPPAGPPAAADPPSEPPGAGSPETGSVEERPHR